MERYLIYIDTLRMWRHIGPAGFGPVFLSTLIGVLFGTPAAILYRTAIPAAIGRRLRRVPTTAAAVPTPIG